MNENGNYDATLMPLSKDLELRLVQEKIINSDSLTLKEKLIAGRDHPIKNVDGYNLRSDCVYRAISVEMYNKYLEWGYIYGAGEEDEYIEYIENGQIFNNNRGVDWYLGGVCLKYGSVVIECPASREYFMPAYDYGCHLSVDPTVRHMKSSGYKNPVPISMVKLIKHPQKLIDKNELNETNKPR